jgi:uncharacterized protein (UPF0297 family)
MSSGNIPSARIGKISIDKDTLMGNLKFTLDVEIEGTYLPSSGTRALTNMAGNPNLKFAFIMFEMGGNTSRKVKEFLKNVRATNFLPIARDLVLQPDPNKSFSKGKNKSKIKVFSMSELVGGYKLERVTPENATDFWKISVRGLEFYSEKQDLNHASFCVIPYVSLSDDPPLRGGKKRTSIKGKMSSVRKVAGAAPETPGSTKVKLYDYYSFDYAIAVSDGRVVNQGILLKRRDNKALWTGTYHVMPDGSYMTGRYHGDTQLAAIDRDVSLTKVSIPYGKIQDFRRTTKTTSLGWTDLGDIFNIKDVITELQEQTNNKRNSFALKVDSQKNFITDFTTLDKEYSFNTMFVLDVPKLLMANTALPAVVKSLLEDNTDNSRATLKEIINKSTIENCEIIRREVREKKSGNSKLTIGSTTLEDIDEYVLTNNPAYANSRNSPKSVLTFSDRDKKIVEEITDFSFQKNDLSNFLRIFTFKEGISTRDSYNSKYQYRLKMIMKDGVLLYARDLVLQLISAHAIFAHNVQRVLESNKGGEISTSSLKSKFGANFVKSFNEHVLPPLLDSMIHNIQFFSSKAVDTGDLKTAFFMRTNLITGDIKGIEVFTKTIENLIEELGKITNLNLATRNKLRLQANEENKVSMQKVQTTSGKDQSGRSKVSQKSQSMQLKNTFTHVEDFQSVLDNTSMAGYEYLLERNNTAAGLKTVAEDEFITRFNRELGKYYDLNAIKDTALFGKSGYPIQKNQTRFFTPVSFQLNKKQFQLPSSFNNSSKSLTFRSLLDILYYKEGLNFSDNNAYKLDFLTSNLTFIDIEKSTINAGRPIKSKNMADTGGSDSKVGVSILGRANWKDAEASQGVSVDKIVGDKEYENTLPQNSDTTTSYILNYILSGKVLSDKVELKNSYSKTTNFVKQKAQNNSAPPQQISVLMQLAPTQLLSSPLKKDQKSNTLPQLLKQNDIDIVSLNVKSLDDYGLWWFNYDNLVEIQYCTNFSAAREPAWAPLQFEVFQTSMANGDSLFCRLVKKTDPSLNQIHNKFLELPIFNDLFIIRSLSPSGKVTAGKKGKTKLQEKLFKITDLTTKYSDDFYNFIQPNVDELLGTPDQNAILSLTAANTTGALDTLLQDNMGNLKVSRQPKTLARGKKSKTTKPSKKGRY